VITQVLVLNGPNLGLHVDVRQTDDEREMISWVHEAADARMPVVIHPAAFTHYSYAPRDALAMRTAPLVAERAKQAEHAGQAPP